MQNLALSIVVTNNVRQTEKCVVNSHATHYIHVIIIVVHTDFFPLFVYQTIMYNYITFIQTFTHDMLACSFCRFLSYNQSWHEQGRIKRRGHATRNVYILCMRRIIDESAGYVIFSQPIEARLVQSIKCTCNAFFAIFNISPRPFIIQQIVVAYPLLFTRPWHEYFNQPWILINEYIYRVCLNL